MTARCKLLIVLFIEIALVLGACTTPTASPLPLGITASTPLGISPPDRSLTCADVDTYWGKDWSAVLTALESCGEEVVASKAYAAYFNYGAALEAGGDVEGAIQQYQAAFLIDSRRQEALEALTRLHALPQPTPSICLSTAAPGVDPAPAEAPDLSAYVTMSDQHLVANGEVFEVRGVNYYPRHAPWDRFLTGADLAEVAEELDLIKQAGFNVLRLFLWYDPLFTCQPEDAIPNEAAFARVDMLLAMVSKRDLKVIITLNDLPDLTFRPLYTDWARYDAQTTYIVRRYRNDPTILAWDLRNEGDLDYGARSGDTARFSQDEVMGWLAHVSQLVQEHDPYHLRTAGWWGDPTPTAPYVELLSFHHWGDAPSLASRITEYRLRNVQPLLLEEVGYHSWAEAPQDSRDEAAQAAILGDVVKGGEAQGLAGWLVWTAFDFSPASGEPATHEHFFGLWRLDLTPKPALEVLPLR